MKKSDKRELLLICGSLITCAILGTGIVATFFDKKPRVFIEESLLDDNLDNNMPTGDPIEEPHPFYYEYFEPPANSFGMGATDFRHVNWTWVENQTTYTLTCDGVERNDLFNFNFSYVLENRKYSYWFTADTKGYYEFTLTFDSMANSSYIRDANHTAIFNYSDGTLFYNFTDIWEIVGQFDSYFDLTDGVFTMVLGRSCNKNVHVLLDPTFGHETGSNNEAVSANSAMGTSGSPASPGIGDEISVYISSGLIVGEELRCGLYDSNLNFVAETDEYTGGGTGWKTLQLTSSPMLFSSETYYVVVFTDDSFYVGEENGVGSRYSEAMTYPTWEDPIDAWDASSDGYATMIYCSYTEVSPISFSGEEPTNMSYNESIGSVNVNVTITDIFGDESTVDWYISTDGNSWTHAQQNTSVLNESVEYTYLTTEYQTTYYWKVYSNDTNYNVSNTFQFDTTPFRTNYFNDTFPNEHWIDTNMNFTVSNGWSNISIGAGKATVFFDDPVGTDGTTWSDYGNWSDGGGDYEWIFDDDGTPSSNTGADGTALATTPATDYIFTEASSIYSKYYYLDSDAFSGAYNITFDFYYHMYGSTMGTLTVYIWDGSEWDEIWTRSGQEQTSTSQAFTHAYAYSEFGDSFPYRDTTKLRISGLTGESYYSDMCVTYFYINTTDPSDGYLISKNITRQDDAWNKFYADVDNTDNSTFSLLDPDNGYVITSGLNGNGNDISSVTNTTVRIRGDFNGTTNMSSWNISWNSGASPPSNTAPTLSGEVPANQSTSISTTPDLHVLCLDNDGHTMNATWSSNSSGSWQDFAVNSSIANNTNITQTNSNFSAYSTRYYWHVNLSDGNGGYINETYYFTTEADTSRSWTQTSTGYLTGGNATLNWNAFSSGYLTGGNATIAWSNVDTGYLTGGNATIAWNTFDTGYLTGGNATLVWTNIASGYLTGGNATGYSTFATGWLTGGNGSQAWTNIITGWLTGGNGSQSWVTTSTGYLTGGNASLTWTNIDSGWLTGGNITQYTTIDTGWLTGGNVTDYTTFATGWLTGGNSSLSIGWNTIDTGYLTGGNNSASINWTQLSTGWLTGGNGSQAWTNIITGWLTGGNGSQAWTNIITGWLTGGNDTSFVNISTGWLTGGNATLRIWELVITGYLTGGNITNYTSFTTGWLTGGNGSLTPLASFTMTVTGYKIDCVSTSTNADSIEGYKWEIEQNGVVVGKTGWINDSSGDRHTFFLKNGDRFRVNFYIWYSTFDDSASKTGYIYPPAIETVEPEPEPEIEYKYDNVFEDAKPVVGNWLEDRSPPELLLIGVVALVFCLVLFSKRPRKRIYYIIRRKRK